jgi:hypothetical protein
MHRSARLILAAIPIGSGNPQINLPMVCPNAVSGQIDAPGIARSA